MKQQQQDSIDPTGHCPACKNMFNNLKEHMKVCPLKASQAERAGRLKRSKSAKPVFDRKWD